MGVYLSVVIPSYNECANIGRVVDDARKAIECRGIPSYEIILVDDGSSDGTGEAAVDISRNISNVKAVSHTRNQGLGAALRTGFDNAIGDIITWIPGDGQFDLGEVLDGLPQMETKDIVVAFRQGRKEVTRSVISNCYHSLIRILFQFEAKDMCGIYIIRRTVLQEIRPRSNDIFLNLEIPLACARLKKPMGTIVLQIKPRLSGVSKVTNVRTLVRNMLELFKYRVGL
jgi:glycosyltransferase involved in cell wall biosynthesis